MSGLSAPLRWGLHRNSMMTRPRKLFLSTASKELPPSIPAARLLCENSVAALEKPPTVNPPWLLMHFGDEFITCVTSLPQSASPSRCWELNPQHPGTWQTSFPPSGRSIREHQAPYMAPSQVSSADRLKNDSTVVQWPWFTSLQFTFLWDSFSNAVPRLPTGDHGSNIFPLPIISFLVTVFSSFYLRTMELVCLVQVASYYVRCWTCRLYPQIWSFLGLCSPSITIVEEIHAPPTLATLTSYLYSPYWDFIS